MPTHNPNNERIKRRYFDYLRHANGLSTATVDIVAAAIARFEADTKFRDFKQFHFERAIAFRRHLAAEPGRAGKGLSKATLNSTLIHLRQFFHWLAGQPGYRSCFSYSDSDYFRLSEKDARIAARRLEQEPPTVEQVKHAITLMPSGNEIERRDRALFAFALLTGARDGAIASFKLKHVDLHADVIHQDANEVKTKFSKTFSSCFFPVGADIRDIVVDWVAYLREIKKWGNDDPLFPATEVTVGAERQFTASGLKRTHWKSAAPIRKVFKQAFGAAGLPYFNPHTLRKTLTRLGQTRCDTIEEFKAFSQNLGHEDVMTTLRSYGEVDFRRQQEVMLKLANPDGASAPALMEKLIRVLELSVRSPAKLD